MARGAVAAPDATQWVRRAQVWLGTLVEVTLPSAEASEARFGAAFAAIAEVHRRMNAHDAASDLARIARHAHRRALRVHRHTFAVLCAAQELARASRGAFDITRPGRHQHTRRDHGKEAMQALQLLRRGRRVRTARPLHIDLGGIAKGYAVDRGVAALRARGTSAGCVHAGGDLRVFGSSLWLPVQVRLPQSPGLAVPWAEVRDMAVATSADTFRAGAGLYDAQRRSLRPFPGSISVAAPSCMLADALTKLVALGPHRAPRLLARHAAHACHIDAAGHMRTTLHQSGPRLRLDSRLIG
jgi:FAD:protein FMN transferase